jgi:hypothetical protein
VNGSGSIDVLDGSGNVVRTLSPGPGCSVHWDARDAGGVQVPEGPYTIRLTITNETQSIVRTCSVVVDNTAPATTIAFSSPPKGDGSYEAGVTFTLGGSDAGSGISSYHYKLNSQGWETLGSPVELNAPGEYTIKYKAIDHAGNYEIQTLNVRVTASPAPTPVPTPAPTPEPTPAATPVPTPAATPTAVPEPSATPAPEPGAGTFDVNQDSVKVHGDGRITYETGEISLSGNGTSFAGSVGIDLTRVPADGGLNMYVTSAPDESAGAQFALAARKCGGGLKEIACVLVVDKENLRNGEDIASATITMKVSSAWVMAHGGVGAIKILRYSEGVAEPLETQYMGLEGDMKVFQARSPNGLSEFALTAVDSLPGSDAGNQDGGSVGLWPAAGALAIVALIAGFGAYLVVLKK